MLKRLPSLTFMLGNIIVLAGLALLAYLGFYNRYWADDWCYSADARTLGTIPATLQYFDTEKTGYSSNRYSLTFFSALIENLLGMFGNQLVAALTIILWLGGLFWIGWNLSRLMKPLPVNLLLLATGILLFYTLYLSPQRFQILYWRSGVLPYSTAIIFWLYLLGFITRQMTLPNPARWVNFIVAPLAFIAAGLGEISCVFLFSGTTLLLIGTWFAKKSTTLAGKKDWAENSFETLFVTWIFLLLGMAALILSPSNARVANMDVKQSSLLSVPLTSLRHGFAFILLSLKGLPLPHAFFIGMMTSLGTLSVDEQKPTLNLKRTAVLLIFAALITFLLIVAIQAPSAYFYSATPDPRGQSLARFTLLLGLAVMAWITGIWVAENLPGKWLTIVSMVVLLAGLAYTTRSINTIYGDLDGFLYRAQIWDERDAIIKEAKAQGILLVEVPAIDTGAIHTRDMFGSTGKGWNQFSENCGARYYGVDGLKVKQ